MIQSIRNWLFYREFTSDARPNRPKVAGINSMRSVGILFDGTDETERKIVHKFKKSINSNAGKNIKSLAFINNILPLDNVDYAAYNQKNLKWSGKPFGEKVDEFLGSKFDLLIVLCHHMVPHYEYIIAHSPANFVIGPAIQKAEKYFDIIVETDQNQNTGIIINNITVAIDKIAIK